MGCYRVEPWLLNATTVMQFNALAITFRDARKVLLPSGRLFCRYRQVESFGLLLLSGRPRLFITFRDAREVLLPSGRLFCRYRQVESFGLPLSSGRPRFFITFW